MAFVQHRLGKTHYTRKGRSGLTPIIWLHGGPGGMHQPDSNVFRLAADRQVYCYTQLGSGKSSKTTKKLWKIETFVAELSYLIDAWHLWEFHLMGGSWGTTLALEYYLRKRGKGVKSLVFQSPLFSTRDWKTDGRRLIKGLPARTRRIIETCHDIGATDSAVYKKAMGEYYDKHVYRNKPKKEKRPVNPNGEAIYEYMWGPAEFEPTGTLRGYTRVADLSKIKVPTLVICGQHDEATPETGIRYANKIPGCAFAEIRDASHVIWKEKPASILGVIKPFLKDVDDSNG